MFYITKIAFVHVSNYFEMAFQHMCCQDIQILILLIFFLLYLDEEIIIMMQYKNCITIGHTIFFLQVGRHRNALYVICCPIHRTRSTWRKDYR